LDTDAAPIRFRITHRRQFVPLNGLAVNEPSPTLADAATEAQEAQTEPARGPLVENVAHAEPDVHPVLEAANENLDGVEDDDILGDGARADIAAIEGFVAAEEVTHDSDAPFDALSSPPLIDAFIDESPAEQQQTLPELLVPDGDLRPPHAEEDGPTAKKRRTRRPAHGLDVSAILPFDAPTRERRAPTRFAPNT
jgi:hypothetical protein